MPKLTIWFIRSAVACLITSLMIGVALALGTVFQLPPIFSTLRPTFFHLFMFGWGTQLIFGVAFWLFPKFSKTQPRGNEVLWWITFWGLNIGLLLRVISEPLYVLKFVDRLGMVVGILSNLAMDRGDLLRLQCLAES